MKKIRLVLLLILMVTTSAAFANNWGNAEWIWQQEDGPSNTWMCFRKTVTLDDVPDFVEAKIAVDSKFWLWINGKAVKFEGGLSRGPSQAGEWNRKEGVTPANSWYEDIDIKPYLTNGENTIAILAWYTSNYSDNDWSAAIEKGAAGIAPWYDLEKNIVPALLNHGLQNYANNDEFIQNCKWQIVATYR